MHCYLKAKMDVYRILHFSSCKALSSSTAPAELNGMKRGFVRWVDNWTLHDVRILSFVLADRRIRPQEFEYYRTLFQITSFRKFRVLRKWGSNYLTCLAISSMRSCWQDFKNVSILIAWGPPLWSSSYDGCCLLISVKLTLQMCFWEPLIWRRFLKRETDSKTRKTKYLIRNNWPGRRWHTSIKKAKHKQPNLLTKFTQPGQLLLLSFGPCLENVVRKVLHRDYGTLSL